MRRGARGARREGLRRGGEVRGDEARGARGEASGLKVERCTLNVGRQRVGAQRRCAGTGSGSSGARQRVGVPRRCAQTGSGSSGARVLKVERGEDFQPLTPGPSSGSRFLVLSSQFLVLPHIPESMFIEAFRS